MNKKSHIVATVLLVVILTMLSVLPGSIAPTVGAAAIPARNDLSAEQATAFDAEPPIVVEHSPAHGEEQPADAPIQLSFSQDMDRAVVEAAFAISPVLPVKFTWKSDREVSILPESGQFERGVVYKVTLAERARSKAGAQLVEPVEFSFQVVGYLEVSEVMPGNDAAEVDMMSTVTVIFNRPVVPLTSLGQQASLPQPLAFTPSVEGDGEWLNTSIYTFTPKRGFAPATEYKARVQAGLTGLMGSVLKDEYSWIFTTKLPAVTKFSPTDKSIYVGPDDVVKVTFNQPMDHGSAEKSFLLAESETGKEVTGKFSWSGEDLTQETLEMDARDRSERGRLEATLRGETMTFTPDKPLALDTSYQASIAKGAKAATGNEVTLTSYIWGFSTISLPAVVGSNPADGETSADYSGGIDIYFSSPIDPATIAGNLTIIPEPTEVYSYWYNSNTELYLSADIRPSSSYTVTIGKNVAGQYGHKLGTDTTIHFTTREASPYISLVNQGWVGTYSFYTDTMAYVSFRNVSELNYSLYSLSLTDFFNLTGGNYWRYRDEFKPDPNRLIRKWTKQVQAPQNQFAVIGTRLAQTKTGGLVPGLYYLEVDNPATGPDKQVMVISPYNLILKQSQKSALLWATDMQTGAVVPNLPVKVYNSEGAVIAAGETNEDGVFQGTYSAVEMWDTMYALVGGENLPNARFGAVLSDWNDGISPWEFNINSELYGDDYNAFIYTDRPIYRPGQKVYFKGILRHDDWAIYTLPAAGRPITVTVQDGDGDRIYEEVLKLNDMGTFNSSLSLDESASLGYYWLRVDIGAERSFGVGFQVSEYRKPQFQVSVETDRPEYLHGDKINFHAKGEYYFGGPVANADVHWSVLTEDASFNYKGKGWYDFTDYDWVSERYYGGYYGGLITEGDGTTNEKGEFTVSVPADIADQINSQRYTIEATITGPNDQQVSNNTTAIIHKGQFYIGLAPQRYIGTVDEEAKIDVITVDWESAPSPNQAVTLVYNKHEWFSVETQAEDGSYYWDSKYVDTPVYTQTLKTDNVGKAVGSFTPAEGGIFRIMGLATDAKGNEIRSSTFMWVSGSKFINWRQENNDRIELVADKKSYQVGDTAEILVPSPYQGDVDALITIERGKVISYERMTLKGNSETIRIPILPEYVPDVFVSVVLVKAPDATAPLASFKLGYVQLNVSAADKEIKIILTPEKEVYQPGDTVTYKIEILNSEGQGVEAELSLNLVDKSVLALADFTQDSMMDTFWRERGVGVQTAAALVRSVDRRNLEVAAEAKGGGGGGDMGDMTVRRRFPDTAYWNATVRTDKDGKAEVKVQLPDTLTTWNMSAKAITADTLVGEAAVDVRSTLLLHVQSVLPRFFVVGDKASIGAVIFNETDKPFEVEAILAAQGVSVASGAQKMEIPAHSNIKLRWDVTVQDVENAKFTIGAKGGGLSDAEEYTLPVYRYTAPETVATAGEVDKNETRTEWIQLPTKGDPKQGDLKLELAPSLAAGIREGLTYLETYPYQCVEQVISRFVPNVMTYRTMKDLGFEDAELEAKLSHFVSVGLQRIYAMQHLDGGWGWWLADDSNPFITAYALLGLVQVERAGFIVEPEIVTRAVGFLEGQLEGSADVRTASRGNTLAFVLYALAEADAGDLGRAVTLFENREQLSHYGKAFLAMTLNLVEPGVNTRINTLLSDLNNGAITSATGVHWEEATKDYWNMTTDTRSTAIVLDALVKIRPDSQIIPNVVRWLMAARQDGRWKSTQETAWTIMALTDYMAVSGELKADYSYKVLLNSEDWTEGTVDKANVTEPQVVIKAMSDLLRDEVNQVSIARLAPTADQTGDGKLYYSMYLKYYLPVPEVKALNRGIMVARQYELENEPDKWIDGAKVGDVIRVKLTIVAPNNLHHVVVEDPLPAGCEALDQSLKTTSIVGQRPELTRVDDTRDYWGWWWFSHTEIRDEKVALFATYLPQGTYEYSYLMRASLPGEFRVMPSTAYEMYFPEVFGRGDGSLFTIAGAE